MRSIAATLVRVFAVAVALAGTACTKTGLNAGRQGGLAWIGMAGMLILTGIILWYFLGREE